VQDKPKANLSAEEKPIRRSARQIRFVAIMHLVLAIALLLMIPELPFPNAVIISLSIINAILALGLIHFTLWSYRIAVTIYFLVGIVFTISVQIPLVLIILLFLYLVGNKNAKAIFERRLPELP
jgi:hypothetical protein